KKNKLMKDLRKKNNDIMKINKKISTTTSKLHKSRIDDEKNYLTKRINNLKKQNIKLTKERSTIVKKLVKFGELLDDLLTKKKIINEEVIKELENTSSKTNPDEFNNSTKRKSIKDKTNPKGKQKNLNYFQKQLKSFLS
ncbi:17051_t:CDS:1, partial [Cetraspora pellucida]